MLKRQEKSPAKAVPNSQYMEKIRSDYVGRAEGRQGAELL